MIPNVGIGTSDEFLKSTIIYKTQSKLRFANMRTPSIISIENMEQEIDVLFLKLLQKRKLRNQLQSFIVENLMI